MRLRVKGPDKQVQNVFAQIPSVKFLIAVLACIFLASLGLFLQELRNM
jgi:hypothetical protein